VNATTEGVVREPSEFGMTTGSPPSMTAMTELVVPKSIHTVFGICQLFLQAALAARVQCLPLSCSPPQPHQNATGVQVEFRSWSAPNLSLDPMAIFELDPVDDIAVVAVGQPGQRRFFLLAKGRGRTLTLTCEKAQIQALIVRLDRKSTRLNSSHVAISYAGFCLKKKNITSKEFQQHL